MRNSKFISHNYCQNHLILARLYLGLLIPLMIILTVGLAGCKKTDTQSASQQAHSDANEQIEQNASETVSDPNSQDYTKWAFDANEAKRRRKETAGSLGIPSEKTLDLGNGVNMEFALIPAGSFYMGSPKTEKDRYRDEEPIREIQISKPFYIGKFEVTQRQYEAVIGTNPSKFSGENLPVENVSWDDAVAFCTKIAGRLPTEAEWEYACRAGSEKNFYYDDDPNYSQLDEYAWYKDNSEAKTHPVGQKKPNAWDLFDMSGNVWEWCSDWYADKYKNLVAVDPNGTALGQYRTIRGGGWDYPAKSCRSALRSGSFPNRRNDVNGFRVVLEIP